MNQILTIKIIIIVAIIVIIIHLVIYIYKKCWKVINQIPL